MSISSKEKWEISALYSMAEEDAGRAQQQNISTDEVREKEDALYQQKNDSSYQNVDEMIAYSKEQSVNSQASEHGTEHSHDQSHDAGR